MAKFTRTAYADKGALRAIANRIANQSGLSVGLIEGVHQYNGAAGERQRVRITILVEPEKAPAKQPRKPGRPRPVQVALPLEPMLETLGDIAATVDPTTLQAREPRFRMPLYGADGGAT